MICICLKHLIRIGTSTSTRKWHLNISGLSLPYQCNVVNINNFPILLSTNLMWCFRLLNFHLEFQLKKICHMPNWTNGMRRQHTTRKKVERKRLKILSWKKVEAFDTIEPNKYYVNNSLRSDTQCPSQIRVNPSP